MKKIVLLVALVLLFSMVLAACGEGEEQGTAVPGSTLGVTEEPGTGLEETPLVGATETTVVETPMATATVALATETQMPTVAVTEPAVTATQSVTGTQQLPGTGAIDPNRLSNMLDFEVIDQNGEEVGEVNDMVLNLRDAQVVYVLVDFGGFLGIGEHTVAVPWDQLTLQTAAEGTGAEGQNAFVLNADQTMIENAPEFNKDLIPDVDEPVEDWDVNFRDYWASGGVTTTMTTTETPGAVGSTASTTTPVAPSSTITSTTGMTQTQGTVEDNRLGRFVLATELLDRNITVNADTSAEIDIRDAIIDPTDGSIQYYIVVLSGMGEEDSWIPVPPDMLVTNDGDNMRISDINPDALVGAPGFTENEFPDTSVEGWDDAFVDWWNEHTDLTSP